MNKTAIGIDIKYEQLMLIPNQINILQQKGTKIIHLIRKNILKTFISLELNRMQEKLGRKSHGAKKIQPIKVELLTDNRLLAELDKRMKEIEYFKEFFSKNFNYLEIYYEDFLMIQNQNLKRFFQMC